KHTKHTKKGPQCFLFSCVSWLLGFLGTNLEMAVAWRSARRYTHIREVARAETPKPRDQRCRRFFRCSVVLRPGHFPVLQGRRYLRSFLCLSKTLGHPTRPRTIERQGAVVDFKGQ